MADSEKGGLNGMRNGAVERTIDLKKMWAIVRKNWMVMKGDKIRLVPLFMFPLIMIVIFGYTSGNMPKHISAGVVDYDNSDFSHEVYRQLSGMELFSLKYVVGTQDEGKRLMDAGSIRVLFILPEGLGDKVAKGEHAEINVIVDESDSSVAQISKSSAQAFAARLSEQVSAGRMSAMSAQARTAAGQLEAAKNLLSQQPQTDRLKDSSDSYYRDALSASTKASKLITATAQELKNSLGFLVDQNEVAESFTPSAIGGATLQLLAVGDQQQSTLQQIALYSAMGGFNAMLAKDSALLYSNAMALAASSDAQARAAGVSAELISSAGKSLNALSTGAENAPNEISVNVLAPYGYGRRGIDFLLPSILALVIFQGATMGLGRAIAGERKDGSLMRVFLTPTSNITIILGTQFFYLLLETVRSSLIIFVAIALFGVSISGNILDIIFIVALFSMGATGVGMVLSVITNNQEQYMAVGMLISLPMMFLSGVFFPIQTMPPFLQSFAQFLPITYASDALRGVMVKGFALHQVLPDIAALAVFGLATLTLSILLFKREVM
ncbi:TPA: ABC transporter permease [Candidatus Micrarchaeota archaeon]|nr:ABC transporter permease [Candidatus Micrarchaeota archaeon]